MAEATAETSPPQVTTEAAPSAAAAPGAPPAPVVKPTEKAEPSTAKKPADFFRQREEKREKKATEELAELRMKHAELEKQIQKGSQQTAEPPASFMDDPDKWAQGILDRSKAEAIEAVQQREQEARHVYDANRATDWLLTRSHLKEDEKLVEPVKVALREKYAHIAANDPISAMRLAYIDVCAEKGVVPDMDGFKTAAASMTATGGASTSGVRHSAAAGGKRVFQKGEVTAYMNGVQPGSKEYASRLAEVEEAYKEGRAK